MPIYQKKPHRVEAWQNLPDSDIPEWLKPGVLDTVADGTIHLRDDDGSVCPLRFEDYAIRKPNGFAIWDKRDFEAIYELVEEATHDHPTT
jgi:hypothetical protein